MKYILHFEDVCTQTIKTDWLLQNQVSLDVLRIDRLHEIISGNKWFKLQYYLQKAKENNYDTIATFGGAYSNHIIATAYLCKLAGLKSIGIIRGEAALYMPHTLEQALNLGMRLIHVSRAEFKDAGRIKEKFKNIYWINEGGYGIAGAKGAKQILSYCDDPGKYSHIICSVGSGTMMAGIILSAKNDQIIFGISAMKGNRELVHKIKALLDNESVNNPYRVFHDYHFGGYAKHPPSLMLYMNEVWEQHQLPTDIVYTAKAFYATEDLIKNRIIPQKSDVLFIHSGGLQGNLSLPPKTLTF